MAIDKVLGTETEFGIAGRNYPEFNPVLASSLVINSYAGARARIQWSYEEESPGRDARGYGYDAAPVGDFETGLVNVVLSNGARLYVDHAHPEYSSPECTDPLEAALYDKAGEVVMARALEAAATALVDGERILVHKNNSDGKGNSYGAHENYLLPRSLPFGEIVRHMTPFFISRQIVTGSGKVGSENGRPAVDYQITQRADFFEEEVGLETTLKRPIINTRDEPHAEPGSYRRLHVIIGDANMAEVQIFLKLGITMLALSALEDGLLGETLEVSDPVAEVWKVSHDPQLQHLIALDDGRTMTALEMQFHYLEQIAKYVETSGAEPVYRQVVETWERLLVDMETDPMLAADRLDWVAKWALLERYRDRDGLAWDDPKLRLLDVQYHDVDPTKGLYHRLVSNGRIERLFTDEQVAEAVTEPPPGTRAWFRGKCVSRYGEALVAANWDSLILDTGSESLKRVPMMEPLRGGRERVADLLDRSPTAADLVRALGGDDGGAGAQADQD